LLEDEIITLADFSYFHLKFIIESLIDLQKNLKKLNIDLIVCRSSFEDFILQLEKNYNIIHIVSTQETGNMATYNRDKRVIQFLKNENILFTQVVNNGVVRALKNRNDWTKIWRQRMESFTFETKLFPKIIEIQ
jgi:deoxyribodipyrimidine photo-lyase